MLYFILFSVKLRLFVLKTESVIISYLNLFFVSSFYNLFRNFRCMYYPIVPFSPRLAFSTSERRHCSSRCEPLKCVLVSVHIIDTYFPCDRRLAHHQFALSVNSCLSLLVYKFSSSQCGATYFVKDDSMKGSSHHCFDILLSFW